MKENKLESLLNNEEKIDLKLSYSRISDFDINGPKTLLNRTNPKSKGLSFGSISDDLLSDKITGNNRCKEIYYKYDGEEPGATLGSLSRIIIENYETIPDKETILNIVKKNSFWTRTKDETKLIAEFDKNEFWEWLKVKFETKDKIIVTHKDYEDAQECVNILLNHKHTHHLFYNDFENYYQYNFEFEYKKFKIRGVIDKLSIDKKNKILYIQDIKTGSSKADEFLISFLKYRYYIQEAVYSLAFDSICRNLNLEGYILAPFKFIFIGRYEKVPHIFSITEKWHNAALNGFKTKSGYKYKGLNENLDLIYYHWKQKVYHLSKEVSENNGEILLNDEFIEVN